MTQAKKHIQELHDEIKNWKSELEAIKMEANTLNKQLETVAATNNRQEVMAQVEHFQNQFIRQNEINDELLHEINGADHQLVTIVSANEVASDHRLVEDNTALRSKVDTNNKLFAEMRHDFQRFASEWM